MNLGIRMLCYYLNCMHTKHLMTPTCNTLVYLELSVEYYGNLNKKCSSEVQELEHLVPSW